MPTVDVDLTLEATLDTVWAAVVDVSSYPAFMHDVLSVQVDDERDGHRRSSWSVLLKGSVLEWTEDEVIDVERHVVDFEQVDGDMDQFTGYWRVDQHDDHHVRVMLHVEFDIGIPLLADMLNPVAERALRENSTRMLSHIEQRTASIAGSESDTCA